MDYRRHKYSIFIVSISVLSLLVFVDLVDNDWDSFDVNCNTISIRGF